MNFFQALEEDGDWELKARSDGRSNEKNTSPRSYGTRLLMQHGVVLTLVPNTIPPLMNGILALKAAASEPSTLAANICSWITPPVTWLHQPAQFFDEKIAV